MSPAHLALRGRRLMGLVIALISLGVFGTSYAAPAASVTSASASAVQFDGVEVAANGAITLSPDAPPPPALLSDYERFGTYISSPLFLNTLSSRLAVTYSAEQPAGSTVLVDVRASADGVRWSAWQTVETGVSAIISLPGAVTQAQYRVLLFGSATALPVVQRVQIQASDNATGGMHAAGAANVRTLSQVMNEQVAPTFRIRATRMGMVGGRTANGYRIPPRAHFVSLPSWTSLSPRGSNQYSVRITYRGRSSTAPVWDVGPWNTRDNYWDFQRQRFPELRRGWPQDHAAYYEKHNGGRAEKGYVRYPTAIDVGDGVWWDDLGIVGDQAEVEVTFLWLGRDPLQTGSTTVDPNAAEVTVDELSAAFKREGSGWSRSVAGCGEGKHAFWIHSTNDPAAVQNKAFWQPALPAEALYDVYVHVPICPARQAPVEQARYLVQHRDGAAEVVVNQATQTAWVHLGRFPFKAGAEGFIYLTDLAGDPGRTIWFDQAKWVRVP